jgi:hypothetical protein
MRGVVECRSIVIEPWSRVPGCCVGVLASTQGIEQLLAVGTARALHLRCATSGNEVNLRKGAFEIAEKLVQIKIGQP